MKKKILISWKTMLVTIGLFVISTSFSVAEGRRDSLFELKNAAISYAKEQIGRPYRFGGTDPKRGFDCSGLIQYVYRAVGVELPRDTRSQFQYVSKTNNPEPGDVIFFKIRGNSISHAGIYLGGTMMIHAPSSGKRVEITNFDTPYWKKRFYGFGKI